MSSYNFSSQNPEEEDDYEILDRSLVHDTHDASYDDDDDEYDDNNDYNNNDDDDDDDDDGDQVDNDDDRLLSYLFDKAFFKQHVIAIMIAIAATAISYFHILDHDTHDINVINKTNIQRDDRMTTKSTSLFSSSSMMPKSTPNDDTNNNNIDNIIIKRSKPLKPTLVHHHHSYRRTNHLVFCPTDYFTPSESNQQRIQRILEITNGKSSNGNMNSIDPNLKLFQFNYPKEYMHLMKLYYHADDIMADSYKQYFQNQTTKSSSSSIINDENIHSDDPNFKCLLESIDLNNGKSTIPMYTIGYIHPDLETYYQNEEIIKIKREHQKQHELNQGLAVLKQGLDDNNNNNNSNGNFKPAELSYKGFTAKFTNLSPNQVHLYWDSRTKAKFVAQIQPFESFTTVTFPGNSFHVTPAYNSEDALQRWTITYDESVLFYDPYSEGSDESGLMQLSAIQREKYNMHQLNRIYGREYLAVTKRAWFMMFPRPMQMHFMWNADYFGQTHVVSTKQTHFTTSGVSLKHGKNDKTKDHLLWKSLDYEDYDAVLDEQSNGNENAMVQLPQYRQEGDLELKLEVISAAPRVFEIDNFLSPAEVDHILTLAKEYNVTTADQKELLSMNPDLSKAMKKKKKKAMNSAQSNAWLRRENSPIMDSIYRRVADVLKIDESLLRHRNEHEHTELNTYHSIAEALHVVQYADGQGYHPRLDASQPSVLNRYQPNRFATIVFFLNESSDDNPMEGGELVFPLSVTTTNHDGVIVKPKLGKAVVFYNLLPDGNLDDLSHHSSKFMEKGEKWMGTLFVWDPIID